jgi:hypothetical protein
MIIPSKQAFVDIVQKLNGTKIPLALEKIDKSGIIEHNLDGSLWLSDHLSII